MTINVDEQLEQMATDIGAAVDGSRARTVSLPAGDAQSFGNATLAQWVDAAKDGVQQAIRGLAADADGQAAQLRSTVLGFGITDGEVGALFQPPGLPGAPGVPGAPVGGPR